MRKKRNYKREIEPDIKFENVKIARFINHLMKDGKKTVAQKVMYSALEEVSKKSKQDALVAFEKAIENVSPLFEVVSKRVGGANTRSQEKSELKENFSWPVTGLLTALAPSKESPWQLNWLMKYWLLLIMKDRLLRRNRMSTEWLKPTGLLLISPDNICVIH